MGGHAGSEVASLHMIEVLEKYVVSNHITNVPGLLRSAITEANRSIHEMSRKNAESPSMGTTCTAMLWTGYSPG